jgi:hypothetical protein
MLMKTDIHEVVEVRSGEMLGLKAVARRSL